MSITMLLATAVPRWFGIPPLGVLDRMFSCNKWHGIMAVILPLRALADRNGGIDALEALLASEFRSLKGSTPFGLAMDSLQDWR